MRLLATTLGALLATAAPALGAEAKAEPTPQWSIVHVLGQPTIFKPGSKEGTYQVRVANVGEGETDNAKQTIISDRLPAGLKATGVEFIAKGGDRGTDSAAEKEMLQRAAEYEFLGPLFEFYGHLYLEFYEQNHEEFYKTFGEYLLREGEKYTRESKEKEPWCRIEPAVICEYPGRNFESSQQPAVEPGRTLEFIVHFEVEPGAEGPLVDSASISGGGGGNSTLNSFPNGVAESEEVPFGYQGYSIAARNRNQTEDTQAGDHPFSLTVQGAFNTMESPGRPGKQPLYFPPEEPHKTIVDLPPGVVANPQAVPQCKLAEFWTSHCPPESQIGTIAITSNPFGNYTASFLDYRTNVYNIQPELGHPGNLGFLIVVGIPFIINSKVETGGDYSVSTSTESPGILLNSFSIELWGVPAAEHPRGLECDYYGICLRRTPDIASTKVKPYLRLPTDCSVSQLTSSTYSDSWEKFGVFTVPFSSTMPPPDGCNSVPFTPSWKAHTSTDLADEPSGLDVDLHVPQNEAPEGVGEADVKGVSFTLPEGVRLNPAAADGRVGCTLAQFAMHSAAPSTCPNASKIGEVEVETPLQNHPLPGSVYIAQQDENPFGSLFAFYAVINDPISGVIIKLAGKVEPNPRTGQITATFEDSPQLPFEDFKLHLYGGSLGVLRTPSVCGTYAISSALTPYSAPESGPAATPSTTFDIVGSARGNCPRTPAEEPAAPTFHAGTASPQAGAYSPFALKLSREDGSQEFSSLETTLPPGLVGKLAGIPYCSDAQLAAANRKTGKQEREEPSCPAATEIGTLDVSAGAGPDPIFVRGHAYLAGPYKGAPVSMAVIVPAAAGPFDLGTVVVRVALYVNPETAQIRAVSDPLPPILKGVPVDVRSLALKLDRPQFTLNPTSCEEMSFNGSDLSSASAVSQFFARFQVAGCNTLPFQPNVALQLQGSMKHTGHPALRAVMNATPGEANISTAQVTLPSNELLDQSHIPSQGICTGVEFASNSCPESSVYGWVTATTPLLEKPLSGPVYLRSSRIPSHTLPDLVADLNGQIRVDLVGRIDSVNGGIRNTFETVPDAPVSQFVLQMKGGKQGLLVNSDNICTDRRRATVLLEGHNGKVHDTEPLLQLPCHRSRHHRARHRARHHHRKAG